MREGRFVQISHKFHFLCQAVDFFKKSVDQLRVELLQFEQLVDHSPFVLVDIYLTCNLITKTCLIVQLKKMMF